MKNEKYFDNVLIKLKRNYSKDETVAYMIKKLKDSEIEKGKLKSEVEELKYLRSKRKGIELSSVDKRILIIGRKYRELLIATERDILKFHSVLKRKCSKIKDLKNKLKQVTEANRKRKSKIKDLEMQITLLQLKICRLKEG